MKIPDDRKYSKEHEWILFEGETVTLGITDYAQSELGDIVFVEFPEVGDQVRRGDPAGTIEAVKTVADLYAPVSGEIVAVNESLADNPEMMNADPYGEGWILKVNMSDPSETGDLLDSLGYEKLIEG